MWSFQVVFSFQYGRGGVAGGIATRGEGKNKPVG